jgi:hypothetical protein
MCIYIHRVSQEESAILREGVPYVKIYRYNPKHLCPKLNGDGDNGQRKVWSSVGSTHCTSQLTRLICLPLTADSDHRKQHIYCLRRTRCTVTYVISVCHVRTAVTRCASFL